MSQPTKIKIDDIEYVRTDSIAPLAPTLAGLPLVLVRGQASGVFIGYMESRNGREVELRHFRRCWYWAGAASCSQLAESGTVSPEKCKWPEPVTHGVILDAIEVLDVSAKAQLTFEKVALWKM